MEILSTSTPIDIPRDLVPVQLPPLPERPLVSVLMANYNYASFIGSAIESVLAQTYENVELIVSDDSSTDDSRAIVESYAARDERVKLVRGQVNSGHTTAINLAYSVSRGQIICFLDSDDTYVPDKVERVVNRFRERPNAGILFHRLLSVDTQGHPIQEIPHLMTFAEGWIAPRLLRNGGDWPIAPVGGINLRRELTDLILPLPVDKDVPGNTGGLIRTICPMLTEVTGINQSLYRYRIHGQNVYGAMSLTQERLNRDCAAREWDNVQSHRILTELGVPERAIDLHRSLQHIRWTFERSLLDGTPRARLVRSLVPVVRRIFADDNTHLTRKLIRATTYLVAVVLPQTLRVRWLNWALGRNHVKQLLANAVNRVGSFSNSGVRRRERRSAS